MAKKRSPDGLDLKKLMRTAEGRWLVVPFFIAIVTVVGFGLVASLLNVAERLPSWALTMPAALSVTTYYGVQLKIVASNVWQPTGSKVNGKDGVAAFDRQSVRGSGVAPIIPGRNNVVNIIHYGNSTITPGLSPLKASFTSLSGFTAEQTQLLATLRHEHASAKYTTGRFSDSMGEFDLHVHFAGLGDGPPKVIQGAFASDLRRLENAGYVSIVETSRSHKERSIFYAGSLTPKAFAAT